MRSFACASACVSASMQVVWLIQALEENDLLASCHWFLVHITFFAVMCLLMFVLSNNTDPTAPDALKAAHAGFKVLQRHSGANLPIKRCVSCLMVSFLSRLHVVSIH